MNELKSLSGQIEFLSDGRLARMKAYRVLKECGDNTDKKIALIKSYGVGDLLYVLRDIERDANQYDEAVIKGVIDRLYDMGIMCI